MVMGHGELIVEAIEKHPEMLRRLVLVDDSRRRIGKPQRGGNMVNIEFPIACDTFMYRWMVDAQGVGRYTVQVKRLQELRIDLRHVGIEEKN